MIYKELYIQSIKYAENLALNSNKISKQNEVVINNITVYIDIEQEEEITKVEIAYELENETQILFDIYKRNNCLEFIAHRGINNDPYSMFNGELDIETLGYKEEKGINEVRYIKMI